MASGAEALIEALRGVGEIEWYGFSESAPHKVIWRWVDSHDEIGHVLQAAATTYRGHVEWVVLRHDSRVGGTDWCLIPAEVPGVQEREGLGADTEAVAWLREHRSQWVGDAEHDFPGVISALRTAIRAS